MNQGTTSKQEEEEGDDDIESDSNILLAVTRVNAKIVDILLCKNRMTSCSYQMNVLTLINDIVCMWYS